MFYNTVLGREQEVEGKLFQTRKHAASVLHKWVLGAECLGMFIQSYIHLTNFKKKIFPKNGLGVGDIRT